MTGPIGALDTPSTDAAPGGGQVPAPVPGANRWIFPALTAGAVALSALAPRLARRAGRRLSAPMAERLAVGVCAVTGWVAVAAAERRYPLEQAEEGPEEGRTDWAYLLVSGPPTAAIALTAAQVLGGPAHRLATRDGARSLWPIERSFATRTALAIAVSELVHYMQHRLAHQWRPLWRSHSVHHSIKRMHWLNAARFHPVDLVTLMTLQALSVAVLGIDPEAAVAYLVLKGIHGQIQHSSIDGRSGWLALMFSTAEQHRWHHAANLEGPAVNYCAVFNGWDRLFGTFRPHTAGTQPRIAGIEGFPEHYEAQLRVGFTG